MIWSGEQASENCYRNTFLEVEEKVGKDVMMKQEMS